MRGKTKLSSKAGTPPGTLLLVGEEKMREPEITIFDYDREKISVKKVKKPEECFIYRNTPTITWINVDGLHDIELIEKLGNHFGLHPLVMEDLLNTSQRPKLEIFEDYIFMIVKMLFYNEKNRKVSVEQVSFVFGKNFVITFQERKGDVFDPIRERLQTGIGELKKRGADYLVYCLLDVIVDNYFVILEKLGEEIEFLEEMLVKRPDQKVLRTIHRLKRETIVIRRAVWPLREILSDLEKVDSHMINSGTRLYLRDLYDHVIQVMETMETYRDMVTGMLDIYLSSINNKMNEIMKVLTIIGTIFLPLTFITGIYGMNFKYMPELYWKWGYFAVLGFMFVIALGMLLYFKKKKWL